ncbi:PREDICTED: putative lactoylglutathione lyase isoform X2 [Prunus mume]|uniref:Lactoylglutathione lyase isoform X2 n=1 Tax=Prunus mume TaxID=102107 RepID=A0ABM0NM71_PRUMU|nr:PREDICTED: putative lactoylglutathione lyase isoform X2 [Prunus mume]
MVETKHEQSIGSSIAAHTVPREDGLEWVKKDSRRFLRANIRVSDLDHTIKFYTEFFGMKVLSRKDFPEEKYSNAVVGFGPQETNFVLGLTSYHNAMDNLDVGTAFDHFGITTQDIYNTVEKIRANGGVITREPRPLTEGGTSIFAFVKDPNGYSFELIQRPPTPEPLCQICINVFDIDRSIEFYNKYTIAMLGYGSNFTETTIIELKYNYNVTQCTRGNGYAQVAIGTNDVYKSAAAVELVTKELGGKLIRPPGPIPKTKTKITASLDTDGFQTVLVDNQDYLKELKKQ